MAIGVDIKIKELFFDREKVQRAMDRGTSRALSRAGAHVRTSARSSIRTRKYGFTSQPGSPPFDHTGAALQAANKTRRKQGLAPIKQTASGSGLAAKGLRTILFGYEPQNESVVIGPVRFGGNRGTSTVPQTLEFGGQARNWKGRTIAIRPRPFMRPALERELPKLPQRWAGQVHA